MSKDTLRKYLTEQSLSRVWQHAKSDKYFAIFTGFRAEFTRKQNLARNSTIATKLRKFGYGFFYVDGHWPEKQKDGSIENVAEDSIFVIADENEILFLQRIIALGKEFDQDGVLVKTNNGTFIYNKTGKIIDDIGDFTINNAAKVYTKLRHRKDSKFVFERTHTDGGFSSRLIERKD